MIYLASPYSHSDPFVREQRYLSACKVLWERYLSQKKWAWSPIVHCHELSKMYNANKGFTDWEPYDLHALSISEALHVILLDGWKQSEGVAKEMVYASSNKIPIVYV